MPFPGYLRTKQTTQTTGQGTLALDAPAAGLRGFQAALGNSSRRVFYFLSRTGLFEAGFGDFNGGDPGTLTRVIVTASSAGGSAVNLSAGVTDVFMEPLPGERPLLPATGGLTLTLADLGSVVHYTGTSTTPPTVTFPAVASVPPGTGFLICNTGTGPLTLDGNASDTINGRTTIGLYPGESAEVLRSGAGWLAAGLQSGLRKISESVSAAVQSAIIFALPSEFQRFELAVEDCSPVAAAQMFLRFSFDNGVTYAQGASDYGYSGLAITGTGSPPSGATTTYVQLSTSATQDVFGTVEFRAQGSKRVLPDTTTITGGALSRWTGQGNCGVVGTATNVLIGFVGQNVAAHRARLYGGA